MGYSVIRAAPSSRPGQPPGPTVGANSRGQITENEKGVDPMVRIDALTLRTQHIISRGSLPMMQLTAIGYGIHAAPQFR